MPLAWGIGGWITPALSLGGWGLSSPLAPLLAGAVLDRAPASRRVTAAAPGPLSRLNGSTEGARGLAVHV